MATKSELTAALLVRFKGVPNVLEEDARDWIERSMLEHEFRVDQDVPENDRLVVLLYAEWDGATQLALRTAYYFNYKDAEEIVDKRMVSEAYRNMADQLWRSYERKKTEVGRSAAPRFAIARRADRPGF